MLTNLFTCNVNNFDCFYLNSVKVFEILPYLKNKYSIAIIEFFLFITPSGIGRGPGSSGADRLQSNDQFLVQHFFLTIR